MKLVVATSGRAKCRGCSEVIVKDTMRVGIPAFVGGRNIDTWLHPECFLAEVDVDYGTRASTCKMSGDGFVKGEARFLFRSGDKTVFVKPDEALPFCQKVVETLEQETSKKRKAGIWSPDDMDGWSALDEAHRVAINEAHSSGSRVATALIRSDIATTTKGQNTGAAPAKRAPAKRARDADSDSDEDTEEGVDSEEEEEEGAEPGDEEEDEEEEEEGDKEVIWARMVGQPWWPAAVDEPATKEQKAASVPGHLFVIFFGASPRTWGWVSKKHTKAFTDQNGAYVSCREPNTDKQSFRRAVRQGCKALGITTNPETPPTIASPKATKTAPPASPAGPGLSDYELARLEAIRRNQAELVRLGMAEAKQEFDSLLPKAKAKAASKGIQPRKKKTRVEAPSRRSSRVAGEAADHVYVTGESKGKVGIAGLPAHTAKLKEEAASTVEERPENSRLPEEDLKLESTGGTEVYGEGFMASLKQLSDEAGDGESALDRDVLRYAERMSKLKIGEEGVAKVVPDRIYAVAAHPNADTLVVAAGDKSGNLGLWNVDDESETAVVNYAPHTRTINSLEFHPTDPSKLYSSAYDGTVRCMDVNKGSFDFVYGTSDHGHDVWLQHAKLGGGNTASVLYVSDSNGTVTAVDIRAKAVPLWSKQCHEKKVNTVSVHPLQPEYIVTASLERCCKIWDVRKMEGGPKTPKPVRTLFDELSVNSATFSPDGRAIASVSQKNFVRLYYDAHQGKGDLQPQEASCNVKHDNKTGRYLPVFHAVWDPKADHAFVIGSMMQPRQVEIYSASAPGDKKGAKTKCTRIMSLQDPEWLGSVQSRNCFRPRKDVVVCGNASGRMHVFR